MGSKVSGSRILVVGGAGSLGSSTIYQLLQWSPKEICIVDTSENNLVEVLRTIRSDRAETDAEISIQPIDYGSPVMERFLAKSPVFDFVLNFSALKHVRSERDEISLLQMLDTNLLKADRFLGWLRRFGHGQQGVFFVSSDKAANPANLMGASKRVMEQMLFWHAHPESEGRTLLTRDPSVGGPLPRVTTARFANVAFSDGSLPFGFIQRLAKQQPLSGPADVRRFLLSLEEAGQLCSIAGILCPNGHIVAPKLDPDLDMVTFKDIAVATLEQYGFKPLWCKSEAEARNHACGEGGTWPCYFAGSDTMGEKLFEEFVGDGEKEVELGLPNLMGIPYVPSASSAELQTVFGQVASWYGDPALHLSKETMVSVIKSVVPTLAHATSERSLDNKM